MVSAPQPLCPSYLSPFEDTINVHFFSDSEASLFNPRFAWAVCSETINTSYWIVGKQHESSWKISPLLTIWPLNFNLSLPSACPLKPPVGHVKSESSTWGFAFLPIGACLLPWCSSTIHPEAGSLFFAIKAFPSPQSTTPPSLRNKTKQTKYSPTPLVSLPTSKPAWIKQPSP